MTDTTAALWAKSAVGAVAIAAIVALAIGKVVPGPDAVAFVKWTLVVWMGSVAVSSGAGAIAKAMAQKSAASDDYRPGPAANQKDP